MSAPPRAIYVIPSQVLKEFVRIDNFADIGFDDALRMFLGGFKLPGEAQKIDRAMEARTAAPPHSSIAHCQQPAAHCRAPLPPVAQCWASRWGDAGGAGSGRRAGAPSRRHGEAAWKWWSAAVLVYSPLRVSRIVPATRAGVRQRLLQC